MRHRSLVLVASRCGGCSQRRGVSVSARLVDYDESFREYDNLRKLGAFPRTFRALMLFRLSGVRGEDACGLIQALLRMGNVRYGRNRTLSQHYSSCSDMNGSSNGTLVRALTLSLLVAVGLSIVGCDSGGSNGGSGDGPAWTGNWKLVEEGGTSVDLDEVWSMTESEFESVQAPEEPGGTCDVERWNVSNIDGNTVSLEGATQETIDVTVTLTVDDSGNLNANATDAADLTFEPADNKPRESFDCGDFQ